MSIGLECLSTTLAVADTTLIAMCRRLGHDPFVQKMLDLIRFGLLRVSMHVC